MSFKREIERLINNRYEYAGSDSDINTGDEIMIFKDEEGQKYGMIVREMD